MLGNGQPVDLYKLFMVVKEKGGYDAVCKNRLWDLVGQEYGLGMRGGSSVELVYSKYLTTLDTWLKKVAESDFPECGIVDDRVNFGRRLMELQSEVKGLLFGDDDDEEEEEEMGEELESEHEYPDVRKLCGNDKVKGMNPESNGVEKAKNTGLPDLNLPLPDHMANEHSLDYLCNNNDAMEIVEEFNGGKMTEKQPVDVFDAVNSMPGLLGEETRRDNDDGDDALMLDQSSVNKESCGCKRKRESTWEMLGWLTGIAKNPCDPDVSSMPEKSKWKSYSHQEIWKQALLFREAVSLKRGFESKSEQLRWKGQKMHPCLYDDHLGAMYNLRQRLQHDKRLLLGKSTAAGRVSSDSSLGAQGLKDRNPMPHTDDCAVKQLLDFSTACSSLGRCETVTIPLGPNHQAEVPEWTGMTSESDYKWLGTQIWPPEKENSKLLIERDPIGKGRQDSCGCQAQGSVECVRLHIAEKRAKVKLELGVAFNQWNLDKVGEEVRSSWTEEEEKKFKDVVKSNLPSDESYFWDDIFRSFPKRSREDLVSYYFNVFLLQRRGYQNRHTPNNIDSDDDESESGPLRNAFGHQTYKSRGFTLLSPKKP